MTQPGAPRSSAFEDALEALYRVFARYAPRGVVMGCTHCVSEEEMAQLTATPLRAHTGESLGRYAFKAMTTWGVESDFIENAFFTNPSGPYSAELSSSADILNWKHGES
ncbi:hypothetical protein [Archangium lansingense]|uniref:Uncharacterized protein n=1 Tax=Archangium lansingense TaxID=2995310 RepID=A0ABT4A858_9BACT|nr:hypothetical protein [Archangium lansinium]MCY1077139.1 hypothetical protein [Archangium lansinium]